MKISTWCYLQVPPVGGTVRPFENNQLWASFSTPLLLFKLGPVLSVTSPPTSTHCLSLALHPVSVAPPPPLLSLSSSIGVGSGAMTAPLSFNRSLEAGSGNPSISTAANPSATKSL
ncbi:hypothetical protein AMECASPLE_003295 [Ameca splendens]|uniref:Uncharacterized protein n=1 Tax=Ameca splendens TaxID=208324 RepID=A0ABV0YLM2_9TELE